MFLILGYMIRNAIMDVADNITDVACKLEGIETYLERMERNNDFEGLEYLQYLSDIAKNTDHIKYDMKEENENEKVH